MSDEEMLKEDMDAMSYEEVLDLLRCYQDLSRFDANTGETESLSHMKHCTNDLNYQTYVAISKCVELIKSMIGVEINEIDIHNNRPRKIKCIKNDTNTWGVGKGNHLLEVGKEYTLESLEIHNWYTVIYVSEFPGVKFNSVSFGEVE